VEYFRALVFILLVELLILCVHLLIGGEQGCDFAFSVLAGAFESGDIPDYLFDLNGGFVNLHADTIAFGAQF
jgi:hypothetical protein